MALYQAALSQGKGASAILPASSHEAERRQGLEWSYNISDGLAGIFLRCYCVLIYENVY